MAKLEREIPLKSCSIARIYSQRRPVGITPVTGVVDATCVCVR